MAKQQDEYLIDKTLSRLDPQTGELHPFWRVYYWALRPDADIRPVDDKNHWHPDSEHATEEAAQKRLAELQGGAERQSILDLSNLDLTKH